MGVTNVYYINSILQSAPLALATFAIVLIFKTSTNFAQGMIGTLAGFITTYINANS